MPKLQLYGSATIVDFGDTTGNYRLARGGYVPKIPPLRRSGIGSRGVYANVVEAINFEVWGSSAGDCYSKLTDLLEVLHYIQRTAFGERTYVYNLKYSPDGATESSTVSPLISNIEGLSDVEETSGITLSEDFDEAGFHYYVSAKITVERTPYRLGSTEVKSSAATNNGTTATLTFTGNEKYYSMTDVKFTNHISGDDNPPSFVVISSGNYIQTIAAATTAGFPSGDARFTYFNDSANQPRTTHVFRFTASSLGEGGAGLANTLNFSTGRKYALIASVRNNSATTSFGVRFGVFSGSSSTPTTYTDVRTIKPYSGSAKPQYVSFGEVALQMNKTGALVYCYVTPSAASGTLDFDTVALVDVDACSIIQTQDRLSSVASGVETTIIANQITFGYTRRVYAETSEFTHTYQGADVMTMGTDVRALLLATEGTLWKQYTGGATRTNTWTLTRYPTRLSPT